MISAAEQKYITAGVESNIRADGRAREAMRHVVLETGVLTNASGSCRLKLDATDVLVGVKLDVCEGAPRFECSVECAPTAAPMFGGKTVDDVNNDLSQLVMRILNPRVLVGLDFHQLSIIEDAQSWLVYVDALVLDYGGNVVDALIMAIKAALMRTRVPRTTVVELGGDAGGMEFEIDDDVENMKLISGVDTLPLCTTVNKIGHRHIIDATPLEEMCSTAQMHIFTSPTGEVSCTHKVGRGGIEPSLMREMIVTGRRMGQVLNQHLLRVLEQEDKQDDELRATGSVLRKAGFFA
ncbi:hypothetical protein RI367_008118 [Sorochytrium milnesiophthora]